MLLVVGIAAVAGILSLRGDASGSQAQASLAPSGYLSRPADEEGSEREPDLDDLIEAAYLERSYPRQLVSFAQTAAAQRSFALLPLRVPAAQGTRATSLLSLSSEWRGLGPGGAKSLAPRFSPYAVRPATVSGQVTALLTGRRCVPGDCRLWVGAAGGGVFRTDDALANAPRWAAVSTGLRSSAIGYLAADPNDPTGQTLYAGTGDPGGSADSEAGVGVFRSANGGDSWSLVAGSTAIAAGAAVSGIVVDPRDARTIYVSTMRALHGNSSVEGGEVLPPGAPVYGVYRSSDGGSTFSVLLSLTNPSGSRTTTKPVSQIALDPNDPDTLYAAVAGEGLFRRSQRVDGDSNFHRILEFQGAEVGWDSRVAFGLADMGSTVRIYAGASNRHAANPDQDRDDPFDDKGIANLYRIDNVDKPAADVAKAWTPLSTSKPGTPGFDSYRYCQRQCISNNVVVSPPGQPDVVWLGGMFDYLGAGYGRTAGKAILRSSDAGASFTDLTTDAQQPPFQMHPDQHAIVFSPSDADVAFIGSDGGVVRTSGEYASVTGRCPAGLEEPYGTACRRLLAKVPTRIDSLNAGLDTLQLQSASISPNPQMPAILIGTQDNGTWTYTPAGGWTSTATGDGGQSGIDTKDQRIRFHTTYQTFVEINHASGDPDAWRNIYAPLVDENGDSKENVAFYMPIIADPRVGGSMFLGMQHVWRTQDSGGPRDDIITHCNANRLPRFCGDWVTIGPDLTSTEFGADRRTYCDDKDLAPRYCFVAAVERAAADTGTLWAATLSGRVFVSKNADGPANAVTFARVDVPTGTTGKLSTPGRFVSGIEIDRNDPNHAWIAYSGYDAYTPNDQRGHVFEVRFDPASRAATWTNLTYNLEDEPITDIVRDPTTRDLYGSTDFGVTRLPAGATAWTEAAPGLPFVAVYGLTMAPDAKTLYAATHGRGLWALDLS